jgi:hypothetical protein
MAVLAVRAFGTAILLFLAGAGLAAAAAESDDWSDAPAEWTSGLDLTALCSRGTRTFDARGEFTSVSAGPLVPPGRITSEDAFFLGYYDGPVSWSPDGPVRDELTSFQIHRGTEPGLMMSGFVRDSLAVSRRFETVRLSGWWPRKTDAAACDDGKAALIEIHYYVDGCCFGKTHLRRARLAVAGDKALVVRFDDYACRLCLSKDRKRTYARFPALQGEDGDSAALGVDENQALER